MAIKTLYPNDQTRRVVIEAIQEGRTVIGWIFDHVTGTGAVFDPSQPANHRLRFVQNVSETLNSGLLVLGNTGIAFAKGVLSSTRGLHSGYRADLPSPRHPMLADDHVQQVLTE